MESEKNRENEIKLKGSSLKRPIQLINLYLGRRTKMYRIEKLMPEMKQGPSLLAPRVLKGQQRILLYYYNIINNSVPQIW